MRTSGVAFAFLALRSRLAGRFTRFNNDLCGVTALQATGATDEDCSRRILILDPASERCFHVRRALYVRRALARPVFLFV